MHGLKLNIPPEEIAAYFLLKALEDGELLTNLKMQKLVFYAYAWVLVKGDMKLFNEDIEAWVNGPVVKKLYDELKEYDAKPISPEWLQKTGYTWKKVNADINGEIRSILDEVYKNYGALTAIELVILTHNEEPWKNARKGVAPKERSGKKIKDQDILREYRAQLAQGV